MTISNTELRERALSAQRMGHQLFADPATILRLLDENARLLKRIEVRDKLLKDAIRMVKDRMIVARCTNPHCDACRVSKRIIAEYEALGADDAMTAVKS